MKLCILTEIAMASLRLIRLPTRDRRPRVCFPAHSHRPVLMLSDDHFSQNPTLNRMTDARAPGLDADRRKTVVAVGSRTAIRRAGL